MRDATRRSWSSSLAAGALAGLWGGEVFLGAGLAKSGADLFVTSPYPELAGWIIVRSIGLYGLLFAGLGLALATGLRAVSCVVKRDPWPTFPWVFGAMVALVVFAYASVWWQLEVLQSISLRSTERWTGATRHGAYALGAGGALASALWWAARRWRIAPARVGHAVATLAAAGLLVLSADLALDRIGPSDAASDEARSLPDRPSRVVVVGLDGLTFRVLSPLVRDGELPAFRRLLENGAWGTYLSYGTLSSPLIWTSMATGKRVRDHGIDDFVKVGDGNRPRPLKSFDRRSRALWNILSLFEKRLAVINWMVTYPPEEVTGYMVPRIGEDGPVVTWPDEFADELEPQLEPIIAADDGFLSRKTALIRRTFAVAHHLLDRDPLDFLAIYNNAADAAEHLHWKHYQPEKYDPVLWDFDPRSVPSPAEIPEIYRRLDRELSSLLDALDDDTLVIVVSDHGQRARPHPRVRLRLDRVLAALGHARMTGAGGDEVDLTRSAAYALVWTYTNPRMRINVNLRGREPTGIVAPADADALIGRILEDLRGVRLDSGTPVFGEVVRRPGGDGRGDVRATLSSAFLRELTRRGAAILRARIHLGDEERPLVDFLQFNVSLSGMHDRQGVIFLHGPGIEPGWIGQRAVTTAFQEVVWQLTDKVDAVDASLPLLARLGLIDRATTLDLTPIVLHALGLPVARDMAGRPRTDLFSAAMSDAEWIATYEGADPAALDDADTVSDDEVLEQLRALGYIE